MSRSEPVDTVLQSAVAPWRERDGRVEVMLITSRRSARVTIPKGHIEVGCTPQESAAKEAFEEAGLVGEVGARSIGVYHYIKRQRPMQVLVYSMQVTNILATWPEMQQRARFWVPTEYAADAVDFNDLARCLRALPTIIDADRSELGLSPVVQAL